MSLITEKDYGTPEKTSDKLVTIEVDGKKVTVAEGTSVMRAAREVDVDIPSLCATDSVKEYGSCRLCLVEVDGVRGTPASCTTPVADGMSVKTTSDRLTKIRRGSFIFPITRMKIARCMTWRGLLVLKKTDMVPMATII